jgi:hypothetical protein
MPVLPMLAPLSLFRLVRRLGWQPSPPPFIGRPGAFFKILAFFEVVEVKGHSRLDFEILTWTFFFLRQKRLLLTSVM